MKGIYFGKRMCLIFLCIFMLGTLGESYKVKADPVPKSTSPKLAIIIDDFGNKMGGTDEILDMPVKLTVAVMPFLRTSEADARRAHEKGHDVLLHLPMEAKQGRREWLGPGHILTKMSDEEIRQKVEQALDSVPYAIGINNHMGSKVTADERVMSIILDVCRERGLFFVDSKTNYWSIVGKLCKKKGLPDLHNDVFLDDVHSVKHILKQFREVSRILHDRGKCVTIGHVGKHGLKTAAAIQQAIPMLKEQGAEFVGISEFAWGQNNPGILPGPWFIVP